MIIAPEEPPKRAFAAPRVARAIGIGIVVLAAIVGLYTFEQTNVQPRTDDASVLANLIGIAPQVEGPVTRLYVRDNQLVKKGDVLFEIDPLPYQYALDQAKSEQVTLERKIEDEQRIINAQRSAVNSARAGISTSKASVSSSKASVDAAQAGVGHAEAGVASAEAEYKLATDTLHRFEPLLEKQFVTVEQIDEARTRQTTAAEKLRQAKAQLVLANANLQAAEAQQEKAGSGLQQSEADFQQSVHSVTTLEPLTAQREAKQAAVDKAAYNLSRCRVLAPFDARVSNLTVSEGAYAHVGQQLFTLIDVRTWWMVGNFRESQLIHIQPGMKADVYVMSKPSQRFHGVVDSIAFGVNPGEGGTASRDLPATQRSLNWIHLATRFPVRVRIEDADAHLFRIAESGVIVVRGNAAER